MATTIDFLSDQFRENPYAAFDELRETDGGVHRNEQLGTWLILRYADVVGIFRDHGRFSSEHHGAGMKQEERSVEATGRSMLLSDPPVHTKLRALVNRAFTPRAVEALRPKVAELAEVLLDTLVPGEEVDIVEAFAAPLTVQIIAEMLGIPPGDRNRLARWSDAVTETASPLLPKDMQERARRDVYELRAYFLDHIRERKRVPADDMVTGLIDAEVDGQRLSEDEVVGIGVLLLAAGNETTRTLLTNAVAELLARPDQFDKVRHNPDMVRPMIEEVLRFAPPAIMTFRRATEDVSIGGTMIPADTTIVVVIASANRDPREFADPSRFDITRAPNRHMSFISGIHMCLGAPLSRLEAQVSLPMLFERFPNLAVGSAQSTRRFEVHTPGYASLPVRL